MNFEQWIELILRFGMPTVLAVGLLWWIHRTVWPAMERRAERAELAHERALEAFAAALRDTNTTHERVIAQIVEGIKDLEKEVVARKR